MPKVYTSKCMIILMNTVDARKVVKVYFDELSLVVKLLLDKMG